MLRSRGRGRGGSGGAASEPGSLSRQVVGNKNVQAFTFVTSVTSRYAHIREKATFSENANWSNIEMTFANFVANSVSETSNYPTLTAAMSILYQGTYYPALMSGSARRTVAGGKKVVGQVAGLTGLAGTEYERCYLFIYPLLFKTKTVNFTVGETVTGLTSGATGVIVSQTDAGTTGSLVLSNETGTLIADEVLTGSLGGAAVVDLTTPQNMITGSSTQAAFLEGTKFTNNSALDYTTSSPVVYPFYTATVVGGSITAVAPLANVTGTAAAGSSATITLAASASSIDDTYNGRIISITSGTGSGQSRTILDYAGSTKVATMTAAWVTPPDATSVYSISATGSGYSGGTNLIAYETQANGTLAIKTIGFGNNSAGRITSGTVTSGTPPAGVVAWINPTVVMSGGQGFGNTTAVPGCALVTGIPSVPVKSLLLIGNSIPRYSTDTTGDIKHSYGVYERAINCRFPVANMAISGGKASYFADYVSTYPLLYDLYMGSTTHALNTLGTNDVQAGDSKATLEGNINTINTYVRTFGTRVANATIITRTTSTDGFITLVNQTPVTGFATGGIADQYNADLISNVVTSQWNVVQLRLVYQDSVSTDKWRVDLSSVPTSDGTHPNLFGIGYGQINSTFKSYFNVLS